MTAELRRWFTDLAKSLTNPPTYFSPELYDLLVVKKTRGFTAVQQHVNLHKHDVFCLGLTYYYITTRLDPKGFHRDKKRVEKGLQALRDERHDPELIDCLQQMLIFNASSRPTFWDMLNFGDKASIAGQNILTTVKGLLGIADTTEDSVAAVTGAGPKSTIEGRPESQGVCSVQ